MHSHKREQGFTLIEVVVAVTLAAVIVAMLGAIMASTLRSIGERRLEQDAAVFANQVLEEARGIDYADLEHASGDATRPGGSSIDPDGPGPVGTEVFVVDSTGLSPAVYTETANGTTFTVTRYITWVDENTADTNFEDYKRVSVLVTWTSRGVNREHRAESLISELGTLGGTTTTTTGGTTTTTTGSTTTTTIGTSPAVDLSPANPSIVGIQDTEQVQGFTLTNLGPDDRFNFTSTEPVGASYTVAFYEDLDGDGNKDTGEPLLVDTNADAKVDTGFTPISSAGTFDVLAVWTPTTSDAPGVYTITITTENLAATATDSSTIDFTLNAAPTTGDTYYFHHNPSPATGNTNDKKNLPMDENPPTGTTLYNLSKDEDSNPGRFIDKGGSTTTTSTKKMLNWRRQLTSTTNYSGTATVTIWVAMKDFANDKSADIRVLLRHKSSSNTGSGTIFGDLTLTHNGTGGWEQMTFNIPVSTTISSGRWLEVKILNDNDSDDGIMVAYDTTSYPSRVELP